MFFRIYLEMIRILSDHKEEKKELHNTKNTCNYKKCHKKSLK